jgi:hypothetical protein
VQRPRVCCRATADNRKEITMATGEKPPAQTVACEVCMKEVPLSAAKTAESVDYVLTFCGLACYEAWQQQKT